AAGRHLPGAWMAGALPLLACLAFLRHNALPASVAQSAIRVAGILAATLIAMSLVRALARHRPPWAWARSLPQSARARVLLDAALLAAACLPVLGAAVFLDGAQEPGGGPIALVPPWLALRGAGAVRGRRPAAAPLLAEGTFLAAWVALLPWIAALPAVLWPWA